MIHVLDEYEKIVGTIEKGATPGLITEGISQDYEWNITHDDSEYWVTEIKPTKTNTIKKGFAKGGFESEETISSFAERTDAHMVFNASGILANGGSQGLQVKDGEVYQIRNKGQRFYETLALFSDGWLGIIDDYKDNDPDLTNVEQTFHFGPYMIKDGVKRTEYPDIKEEDYERLIASKQPRQAIGQKLDGTIYIITVDGRRDDAEGMTIFELADLFESLDCIVAYNLDGGGSAQSWVEDGPLNFYADGKERPIKDFMYLTSDVVERKPYHAPVFWDDEHLMKLEDHHESYEFSTQVDNELNEYLIAKRKFIVKTHDGTFRPFIIDDTEILNSDGSKSLTVYAVGEHIEIADTTYVAPRKLTGATPETSLGTVLAGTRWEVGDVTYKNERTITFDKYMDGLEALYFIAKTFDLVPSFRVEMGVHGVSKRYVDLIEPGEITNNKEFKVGKDVTSVRRRETTDNVCTRLIGVGPQDEDGNYLTFESVNNGKIYIEDEDAFDRYNVNGQHIYGFYEYQGEEENLTPRKLLNNTKNEFKKRIESAIEYEVEAVDFERISGYEHEKVRIGDNVKVKDETVTPHIYVEARIIELSRSYASAGKDTFVLGYFNELEPVKPDFIARLQRTLSKKSKEWDSKIDLDEMLENTYDKETIDEKDEQVYTDGKTFAEATGVKAQNNAKDYADEQDLIMKNESETYAELQAQEALEQAKVYAVAKDIYDTEMARVTADIKDRAPINYVDGKLAVVDDRLSDFDIQIDKKADGDTVYTIEDVDNMINNTVSKTQYRTDIDGIVSDIETHGTRIGQNTEAIGLKADDSKVNALENSLNTKIGDVEVKADRVGISVDEVKADLDGLEIGGRNLIKDSATSFIVKGSFKRIDLTEPIKAGNPFSFQTKYNVIKGSPPRLEFKFRNEDGGYISGGNFQPNIDSLTGFVKLENLVLDVDVYQVIFYSGSQTHGEHTNVDVEYVTYKSEKGTKATDWTPAPEDTDEAINNVSGRVESLNGEIETIAGQVKLKANQTIVDSLDKRVEIAEGELKVLPSEINAKVSKDDLYAEINLNPKKAKIEAKNIELKGAVTVLSDIAGDLGNITAGTISGTKLLSEKTLSSGPRRKIEIDDSVLKVHEYSPDGTLTRGMTAQAGSIELTDKGDNTETIISGNLVRTSGQIIADGFFYSDAIDQHPESTSRNIYIRPSGLVTGGEVRLTNSGTTNSYGIDLRARYVKANAYDINDVTTATHVYVRPTSAGALRVTRSGSTSSYRPVEASGFDNKSLAELKQDILPFNGSALDILENSQVHSFRYRSDVEVDENKTNYGFIIGKDYKVSDELLSQNRESVSLYNLGALNTKAVQELHAEFEAMKYEMNLMNLNIQHLKGAL